MKKTKIQLSYGARRISYLTAAFAEAYADIATYSNHTPLASRVALLLMVRNLDEFFYKAPKKIYKYDIRFSHFVWNDWQPDTSKKVSSVDRKRMDQTIAHVIDHDPGHFGNRQSIKALGRPTFEVACEFLRQCRTHTNVAIDPKMKAYVERINELIPKIEKGYKTWRIAIV